MSHTSFLNELKKLRESSKHAVAQGNSASLDSLKQYLHIERPVEIELENIIIKASAHPKAQLILVCGNVGDGKSHVLSHLHRIVSEEIKQFYIHNDATESHNPNETSNETLYKLLDGFKDGQIESSTSKLILAINLGTLSKFLEEYGTEFSVLKEYISKHKILDNEIAPLHAYDKNSAIHHVNFTDYHLYSLTEKGTISQTISTLLKKIVSNTENNPIYRAYVKYKDAYAGKYYCPILYNYEFLFDEGNRAVLTQLIIKAAIQSKEIISVRTLLNYIHDILVPVSLSAVDENEYRLELEKKRPLAYFALLLPYYIFEHSELSSLFDKIEKLDPCAMRKEELDSVLLKLANTESPANLFREHISSIYFQSLYNFDKVLKEISRLELAKIFIRVNYFSNYQRLNYLKDKDYDEYLVWLYHYNCHNISYLEKIYRLAISSIKKWNGDTKSDDKAIINVGKKQNKYRIFREVNIEPYLEKQSTIAEPVLHRFTQEFTLCFDLSREQPIRLSIDYGLFKMMKMISRGYRPNKKDHNNYVYFVDLVNKLINHNTHKSGLYIDEVNIGKSADFKLSSTTFGGYKFERI